MTVKQAAKHRIDAKPVTPLNDVADTASMRAFGKRGIAVASATGIALTAAVTSAASSATLPNSLPQMPSADFVSNLEATDSATLVSLDIAWEPGDEVAVKAEEPVAEPEPEVVSAPAASRSASTQSVSAQTQAPVSIPGASASGIAATALQYVGYGYSYGGSSPATGFDCSGFTSYIFGLHGIGLPRTAASQGGAGTVIPASAAQPGDLVVWTHGGHVGIYLGNGQIVHASTPSTGVVVGGLWGSYYFVRV